MTRSEIEKMIMLSIKDNNAGLDAYKQMLNIQQTLQDSDSEKDEIAERDKMASLSAIYAACIITSTKTTLDVLDKLGVIQIDD